MKKFTFSTHVHKEWVDYNGHMRDAFYGLVFSFAVDSFMIDIGIDEAYREKTKGTIYVVEDHRFYLDEAKQGDEIQVESIVLDSDAKRIHLYQRLMVGDTVACACESMQFHISQAGETPRSAPMPDDMQALLQTSHPTAEQLAEISPRSRTIGIRRKK